MNICIHPFSSRKWRKLLMPSSTNLYEEIFEFASAKSGLDLSDQKARNFVKQWQINSWGDKLSLFKKVFEFAYSEDGLSYSKSGAQEFAENWIKSNCDKNFDIFSKIYYQVRFNEKIHMKYSRGGALKFSYKWVDSHYDYEDDFVLFANCYIFFQLIKDRLTMDSNYRWGYKYFGDGPAAESFALEWVNTYSLKLYESFIKLYTFLDEDLQFEAKDIMEISMVIIGNGTLNDFPRFLSAYQKLKSNQRKNIQYAGYKGRTFLDNLFNILG